MHFVHHVPLLLSLVIMMCVPESNSFEIKRFSFNANLNRNREVTLYLDDDQFVQQVSIMRINDPFTSVTTGNFTSSEVKIANEIVEFKLFDFKLFRRLLANAKTDVSSEISFKVNCVEDLVVVLVQPLAYWVRCADMFKNIFELEYTETFEDDFLIQIDTNKLEKFLENNISLKEVASNKLFVSNLCVKDQFNKVFQMKSIVSHYLKSYTSLNYDSSNKLSDLSDKVEHECANRYLEFMTEFLIEITPSGFDLTKMMSKKSKSSLFDNLPSFLDSSQLPTIYQSSTLNAPSSAPSSSSPSTSPTTSSSSSIATPLDSNLNKNEKSNDTVNKFGALNLINPDSMGMQVSSVSGFSNKAMSITFSSNSNETNLNEQEQTKPSSQIEKEANSDS